MPKRIIDEESENQFAEDDEQQMEQELEEEEEQEQPERIEFEKPSSRTLAVRNKLPSLPPLPPARPRPPVQRQPVQPIQRQIPPIKPQVRYQGFVQQAAEGVVDVETQEVIATDIWTALANIIERLERIENTIGSMTG